MIFQYYCTCTEEFWVLPDSSTGLWQDRGRVGPGETIRLQYGESELERKRL